MFSNLTNFGYNRSAKQAVGFYLAYLLAAFLLGGLAGGVAGAITGTTEPEVALRAGTLAATALVLVLGTLIAKNKGLLNSFLALILIIVAACLTLLSGGLGGLIPIAYLTTLKSAKGELSEA